MNLLASLLNHVPAPVASRFPAHGIANRFVRPIVERSVRSDEVIAVVRSGLGRGIKLQLDPKSEKYYWAGKHDVPVQEALMRALKDGAVFWDVGAHIGFFTVLGARAVGPSGQVHAFEPMPANRVRLERTVRLNATGNIQIHDAAIGSLDGPAVLHGHEASAMWTLVPERGNHEGVEVPCRTIDSLASQFGDPGVMKVDVEGAELDAIRGGLETIQRAKPIMVVEFAVPENVTLGRALLPSYRFDQLSDLDWMLTSSDASVTRAE